MRNPKNSWDRSDSFFGIGFIDTIDYGLNETAINWIKYEHPNVKEFSKEYDEYVEEKSRRDQTAIYQLVEP